MCTVPPATPPRPRTANGSPSPSTSTPRPRNPSSSWRDRPGPGLLRRRRRCTDAVAQRGQGRNETQHRAGQSAVDACRRCRASAPRRRRPRRRRRRGAVRGSAAPRSSGRCRGCAAPRAIVESPGPCAAASAARISARLVIDFEPGTVTVAWTGAAASGAGQCVTATILHHAGHAWSYVREVRGHHRSGPVGRGDRRRRRDRLRGPAPNWHPAPNYNVAPTTDIAAVVARHDEPDDEATRRIRLMRWGLLPPWVKAGPDGRAATQESADQRPRRDGHHLAGLPVGRPAPALPDPDGRLLRVDSPARRHRGEPEACPKTPFYFYRPDGGDAAGGRAVVGVAARSGGRQRRHGQGSTAAADLHDRSPPTRSTTSPTCTTGCRWCSAESDWDRWLDPDAARPRRTARRRRPTSAAMAMREVSTLVNNVANNGPELIEPAGPGDQPVGLF